MESQLNEIQAALIETQVVEVDSNSFIRSVIKAAKSRKEVLAKRKQESYFKKMVSKYTEQSQQLNSKIARQLELLEESLGSDDFAMLATICTTITPEVKNESGEVTQEAREELNKQALLIEGKNLIALKREDRIKAGLRKRSSGRSNRRRLYAAQMRYINSRNEAASQEK